MALGSSHKVLYCESKSTAPVNPPPQIHENMRQFDGSRLAKVMYRYSYHIDECPVEFSIWPVDDSKEKTMVVFIPFIIFG